MWHCVRSIIIATLFFSYCDAFEKLTILTQSPQQPEGWMGHAGVNRSLLKGLSSLGVNYNFNPSSIQEIGDVVLVPANENALHTAIRLKNQGRIQLLLAGPNMVVWPSESNGIVGNSAIDCCIVPCEWCKVNYERDLPSLCGRIAVLPSGVDTAFWQPTIDTKSSNIVIVYRKNSDETLCVNVENILRKYGWIPYRLTYGSYQQNEYKDILNKARFAVFLSRSESQGLALAECWSNDVPTLVWDPQEPTLIGKKMCWPISAAPYLSQSTGRLWRNLMELELILHNIITELPTIEPRAWVLQNMSDDVCASRLLTVINNLEAIGSLSIQ